MKFWLFFIFLVWIPSIASIQNDLPPPLPPATELDALRAQLLIQQEQLAIMKKWDARAEHVLSKLDDLAHEISDPDSFLINYIEMVYSEFIDLIEEWFIEIEEWFRVADIFVNTLQEVFKSLIRRGKHTLRDLYPGLDAFLSTVETLTLHVCNQREDKEYVARVFRLQNFDDIDVILRFLDAACPPLPLKSELE